MSAIAQAEQLINTQSSVTTIGVNARIDYILRFSKQTILIIDDDSNICSNVCSHFLGALPDDHNAAYISVSTQLNDIQLRCRIIEQLFANTLFDPEQSLAVSLVNLAKSSGKAISIVVENMQNASLQLLHELSQTAVIAKKSNLTINVVLSGATAAALLASENSSLFHNKLALLSASTGQLLALNSKLFKTTAHFQITKSTKVITIIALLLAFISGAGYFVMQNVELFSFSQLPESKQNIASENDQKTVLAVNSTESTEMTKKATPIQSLAKPAEISAILFNNPNLIVEKIAKVEAKLQQPIQASDIAMILEASIPAKVTKTVKKLTHNKTEHALNTINTPPAQANQLTLSNIDHQFYQGEPQGYVIQYSGFTQQKALDEFLLANRAITYQGYNRLLNGKPMLVLTSEIFPTLGAAKAYLITLPDAIKATGAFIKSTKAINTEINAFESSQ